MLFQKNETILSFFFLQGLVCFIVKVFVLSFNICNIAVNFYF